MWLAVLVPILGFFVGVGLIAARDPRAHQVVLVSVLIPAVVMFMLWAAVST